MPTITKSKISDSLYQDLGGKTVGNVGNASKSADNVFNLVQKSTASIAIDSNKSVREPFTRHDYDRMRPAEALPTKFKDVVNACRTSYFRVGIVRNVIDMMTDFASEDLRIVHPDKKIEAFLRVWMKKAAILEAVDEFIRHFLLDGNVVIKRVTAQLTQPVENQWMEHRASAEADQKLYTEPSPNKREIPWKYIFLNVAALEWIDADTSKLTGKKQLAFRVAPGIANALTKPSSDFRNKLVDRIPKEVMDTITIKKSNLVPLDMEKLYVAHNKKDSWDDWAWPFLYAVLSEIKLREKLQQADRSAIDGVINVIRIWKLGDHKEGILPTAAVTQRLSDILEQNTGGGTMDIVWDSMIECQELYPPVDKILGSEKYEQVNRDILIGLGVPEVLIGGQGSNFSNSWIQLRTLVEKLEYVRTRVEDWLMGEISALCKAMDITTLPTVRFNQMNLEDENITRKLIVGLLDRGVISVEAVLQAYGEDYLIEVQRMSEEAKVFKKMGIEPKSPLDQPEPTIPGGAAPKKKKKSTNPQGKPPKEKTVMMKTRTANPRRSAGGLSVKGLDAVDAIDEYVIPVYMESIGVSNARKLTSEQKEDINNIRVHVLSCIKPTDSLDEEKILDTAENGISNPEVVRSIRYATKEFLDSHSVEPTLSQRKRLEALAWAETFTNNG